jgi:DNA-binding NarL/FixJ family response regulator
MEGIQYIIADDHQIFRQGLKFSLSKDKALQCIGEAGNGTELMQLLQTTKPDVILMDLKMPEMDGLEATRQVRELYPDIRIIVLTMYDDENFIIHMLDIGANSFLVKNAEPEEIQMAIHSVHENEYYFNDLVSKTMLKTLVQKNKGIPRFKKEVELNDKETDVLRLICEEHTNAEIAAKVFLSPRTIEGIRAGLLEKIGVRNTAGLVLYAVKHGIVSGN